MKSQCSCGGSAAAATNRSYAATEPPTLRQLAGGLASEPAVASVQIGDILLRLNSQGYGDRALDVLPPTLYDAYLEYKYLEETGQAGPTSFAHALGHVIAKACLEHVLTTLLLCRGLLSTEQMAMFGDVLTSELLLAVTPPRSDPDAPRTVTVNDGGVEHNVRAPNPEAAFQIAATIAPFMRSLNQAVAQ